MRTGEHEEHRTGTDRHEGPGAVDRGHLRYCGGMGVYTMGRAAELLGVSVDSLRYRASLGQVETLRTTNGQRLIDSAALAQLAMKLAADQAAKDGRLG